MIRRYGTLLFLALAAGACAHVPLEDRSVLDAIRAEIQEAENSGSTARMRPHITDDVVMMAPNFPPVAGAEPAMAAMSGFFDTFKFEIEYESQEIVFADGWAFDRGNYNQRLTPKRGGPALVDRGKYLWVYRRDGGAWKQARVIWNTSLPMPQPAP